MTSATRGKGKPLAGLHVDTSAAGAREHATEADIALARALAQDTEHHEITRRDWIPESAYLLCEQYTVILCVDLMVRHNETGEYLLVKRANAPLKDEWWVVGGRVNKGETDLRDAATRKAREEIGVDVFNLHPMGYYTEVYYLRDDPDTEFRARHTLSIVFSAEIGATYVDQIKLDEQSSEWKFAAELPLRFRRNCNLSGKMFL